jgi:hypothetical protein
MKRALPLVVLALPLLVGAMVRVQRPVPALLQFEGVPAAVGLVEVHASESIMQRAPSDFANMTGLVAAAAEKAINRTGSGLTFKDFTGLGYQSADIQRAAMQGSPLPYTVNGLPGLPVGVDTPLVTVVEVVEWRIDKVKSEDGKQTFPAAHVGLVMSTWMRNPVVEVDSRYVRADLVGPGPGSFGKEDLSTAPGFGMGLGMGGRFETLETKWFLMADGRRVLDHPDDSRDGLFKGAVNDAVGVYFLPYMPHVLGDAVDIRGGKLEKDALDKAKGGDLAGAQAAFEKVAADNPTDEVAPFDAAMCRYALGDVSGAVEWMKKSIAVKSSPLAQGELAQFQHELDMTRKMALQ